MASTILSDNGVSSGSAGIKTTGGNDGTLALQTTTAGGAATTALTIDTSQNVGIGTSSPATNLTISSGSAPVGTDAALYVQAVYTGTGTVNAGYTGKNYYGTSHFFQWENNGTRLGNRIITNAGGGNLVFTYGNDTEGMRLNSSGNLGIGTSSPAYKLDIQGTLGVTGAITPSQTAGIVGTTTNNNANAGSIGEVVSSSVAVGSAVSLTTATGAFTGKTITSISLTAGDWDVFGAVGINNTATTNFTVIGGGINNVTDTLSSSYEEETRFIYSAFVPNNVISFSIQTTRVSIASTTTYYLIGYAQFTVSTATAFGRITARRRR